MQNLKSFFKELWSVIRLPEMLILPGNLAFFMILSLIPLFTLIGLIASSLSLSVNNIVNTFSNVLPQEVAEILASFLVNGGSVGSLTFIVLGIFVASNGPDSIITASNILYKNKRKNYIYRRVKAIFMTFWLMLLFVATLLLMAFGTLILTKLTKVSLIGEFIIDNYIIITIIKFLLAFFTIFFTIKIIYTMAPDTKIKSKYVNRGSLFTTVTIMVVTTVYSFYVNNIAHYDLIYGSLSNIAILMLLVYIISYVIVLGIAINHNYYQLDNNTKDKKQ